MFCIGRHINGITLNEMEYVINPGNGGIPVVFESKPECIDFLKEAGYPVQTEEELEEDCGVYLVDVLDVPIDMFIPELISEEGRVTVGSDL